MRIYSFFLPQFHSTPANDEFWGDNFTDWVTTRLARPLYRGHKQPNGHIYGEYDLDDEAEILRQSELASSYGVDAFGVYHYWFDERARALEGPIEKMSTIEDLPIKYFVCWVNVDWTKSWIGEPETIIRKQLYNNEFFEKFTDDLIKHFKSPNYEKINNSPIIYVHRPTDFNFIKFKALLLNKALASGIENIRFMTPLGHLNSVLEQEFDYAIGYPPGDYLPFKIRVFSMMRKILYFDWIKKCYNKSFFKYARVVDFRTYVVGYTRFVRKMLQNPKFIPVLLNQWDNTPRYGVNGFVFDHDTPEVQYELYDHVFQLSNHLDFIMIKAWNEWAEGNTLEPCEEYGLKKLQVLKKAIKKNLYENY